MAKAKKKNVKVSKETEKKATKPSVKVNKPIDLERLVELDIMRTTEAAALNAYRWLGKGDAKAAHNAAIDAIRGALDITSVSGTVVFGDGLKPQAGGISVGEKLGNWADDSLKIDLAMVPIDGLDLVAKGYCGAISVVVAAAREGKKSALLDVPSKYMLKIAYGPTVKEGPAKVHLNASVRDNLEIIATKLGKRVQDLNVAILERDRHKSMINDICKSGASAMLIRDGDIAACMAPSIPETGVDVYMGIGGSAEAVMAAAAIRCLGGDMLARVAPVDEKEEKKIAEIMGKDAIGKQFCADELVTTNKVTFCATGISDGSILRGIHIDGNTASSSSLMMRAHFNTVRRIRSTHDLSLKTIRLRSFNGESKL